MGEPRKTDKDEIKDQKEIIRRANKENIELRRELRERSEERWTAEKVRKEVFDLAEYSPDPPTWLNKEPGKSSTGIPLICVNDWHWGEYVDPDQVGGVNKFNRAIARERVRVLHDTVVDLCFNHMTNPNYPGAVVAVLGDMITGNIHEDLAMTNDGPVMWSVNEVENQLIGLIKSWKKRFGKIAVICVPGNHGRNTVKPRINNRVYESYEWLISCHIEQYFRGDPNVSVYVPNEVDAHFSIYGHRIMATHGDTLGVKGGDGLIGALGPIARGALKVGAQQRQVGRDFGANPAIGLAPVTAGDETPNRFVVIGLAFLRQHEVVEGFGFCETRRDIHDGATGELMIALRPDANAGRLAAAAIVASADQTAVPQHGIDVTELARAEPRDHLRRERGLADELQFDRHQPKSRSLLERAPPHTNHGSRFGARTFLSRYIGHCAVKPCL